MKPSIRQYPASSHPLLQVEVHGVQGDQEGFKGFKEFKKGSRGLRGLNGFKGFKRLNGSKGFQWFNRSKGFKWFKEFKLLKVVLCQKAGIKIRIYNIIISNILNCFNNKSLILGFLIFNF